MKFARLLVLALASCADAPRAPATEVVRYLRMPKMSLECSFSTLRDADGWTITSVTGPLTVEARYDASDRLLDARVALRDGKTARVDHDVDVPRGVIVTSAPDWTDTFRICRLWDRARGGRQEFPGLWIHPVQPTQRLTFAAEFVRRDGELDVVAIRLRGNSPYRAWVDPTGRMIKLVSLPVKEGSTVLVLQGFESAATALPDE